LTANCGARVGVGGSPRRGRVEAVEAAR
jgi:hypothetical protein